MVHRSFVLVALILVLTVWAYRSVATADFVYEDHNGEPGGFHAPWAGWTAEAASVWQPVVQERKPPVRVVSAAIFRLNEWAAPSPRGFHLVNLGLHLVNVILLTLVLRPLLHAWSVVAAGIFALHPLQTEAVVGVAYRGELVATLFVLLALLAAWRLPRRLGVVLATACGLLALLSKETTAAVLVFAWPILAPAGRRVWPWAAWTLVLASAVYVFWASAGMLSGSRYAQAMLLNVAGFWMLLGRAIVPLTQTIDLNLGPATVVLAIPVLVLSVAAFGLLLTVQGRTARWLAAGCVWCVACLLVRIGSPSSELVHEHAMYLPLAGLSTAVVAAWSRTPFPMRGSVNG